MPLNNAPTFSPANGTGKLITAVGTSDDARSVTIQPDGKILVAGTTDNRFGLVRLNADGSLDTAFSGDGKLILGPVGIADRGSSATLQADGKIVVAGYSSTLTSSAGDFAVARLNADGSLDPTFNGTGKLLVPVGENRSDYGLSVMQQPDGKVLVSGYTTGGSQVLSMIRLSADGSLDTSFNGTGKLLLQVGVTNDVGHSVVALADGKILVGGYSLNSSGNYDFSLVRLNANGTLDTTFNGTGKLLVPVGSGLDLGHSLVVQSDGKMVLAGYSWNGSDNDFSLVSLNANGTLDTTFNDTGKLLLPLGSGDDAGYSVALQPDGKIVLAGHSFNGSNYDFSLARLNANGSLDTTFNGTGKLLLPVGSSDDRGYSAAIQPDGKIVVAGTSNNDFGIVRLNADGSLDTEFNGNPVNTLGGTISYIENAFFEPLDDSVAIYDANLAILASGAGNYSGSLVVLQRHGAPSPQDVFFGLGFAMTAGDVVLGDVTVGTYDGGTGTLRIIFNDNASQARVNQVLSNIGYANSSDAPPASVQIDWTFSDGNSGSQGTGGALMATGTTTINITAGNDAPVFDPSGNPSLPTVLENATNPSGVTIAALVIDGSITDADGAAMEAIAIEAVDTSLGTWQYSLNGGATWLNARADLLNSTTDTLGLLLEPTHMLRLLPFGDLNGTLTDAITFRAWDMSAGSAGDYVVTSPGTGAFSGASDTANITVSAVNDAPTFTAGTGKLLQPVGSSFDLGYSVAVQPDGKILIAGESWSGSTYDFSLIRLNPDGSLDGTFSTDGKLLVPVGTATDEARSITVQPDGKILVAGYSESGSASNFGLIRLNADGSLDTGFGTNGKLAVPMDSPRPGIGVRGFSVVLQSDGKIVVVDSSTDSGSNDFAVVRYTADGALDVAFDGDGKLVTDFGSGTNDRAYSVATQSDGKIVVAGESDSGGSTKFAVARYNPDGSLDSSFDGDGKLVASVGSSDIAQSVVVQPDGKILMASRSWNGSNWDFGLLRLNANGSLDSSFDGDGKLVVPVGSSTDEAFSVALQADGKIVVAGFSLVDGNNEFSVIRLNANGSLDTSFDADGKVLIPVGSDTDISFSVTIQPDGRIVVAGYSFTGADWDFSVMRLNADGSLDTRFNGTAGGTLGGTVSYTENAVPVTLDSSVAIHDVDLAALGGGAGNYDSASVSLSRNGGANAQDVFSALDSLTFTAGSAVLSGVTVGTVSNTGGVLTIAFNANATQARVNELLSSIGYANSSDAPPASVQIAWTFSDGNSGSQGAGEALTATGTTTVSITAVNDPPTGSVTISGTPTQGETLTAANTLADADGLGTIAYQWQAGGTDIAGATTATLLLDQAQVGKAITVVASYTDGGGTGESVAASATTPVADVNDPPVLDPSGSPGLPAILENATNPSGIAIAALVIDGSITDVDGAAMDAIAIEAVDTSLGTWQYSLNGGATWLNARADLLNSTTDTLGLLLEPTHMLRLLPFGDLNGTLTDAITFRAWDMSAGSAGDYVVTSPGTGAFSGASDTAALTISPVNDAPTFAPEVGTGAFIHSIGDLTSAASSVTLQPDGKIVVAGQSWNGSNFDFSVIRINPDGSLDTTFDADGKLLLPVSSGIDGANGMALQADGKILVAGGSTFDGARHYSLVRLNADGSLDTSFDTDGILIASVSGGLGNSVTVQPDGKIVMAGSSNNFGFDNFSLIRINEDGTLDTGFGVDGEMLVSTGANMNDYGRSVLVQPDGKILTAGSSLTYSGGTFHSDFGLIRLNPDGSLDTSFDSDGKLLTDLDGADDGGAAAVLQPDGKILVVGSSYNGTNDDFSLIRLNGNGTLDASFDGDGKVVIPVSSGIDNGHSVALQPDGKILVVGRSSVNGNDYDFSAIRLNADGSLDTTFDGDGKLQLLLSSGFDSANAVTIQPDGKIVLAGSVGPGFTNFGVVRLNVDGSLDTAFNGTATNTVGGAIDYTENAAPVALDSSVAIYDADLATLAGGAGNYAGASISLSRVGGPSAQDVFSALGSLTFSAGSAELSGVTVGTVSNSGGQLTIVFNANATQLRVNEVLSSIGYANSSDTPAASAQIVWTFNDGNAGSQGSGAALVATGTTIVDITAVNDPPTGSVTVSGTAAKGEILTAINTLADAEGLGLIAYQWKADGANITGAIGSTLLLGNAEVGKAITVAASYTDLGGTAESVTSPATAPVAQSLQSISTGGPGNDTLASGGGVRILAGGLGDDTYIVNATGVTVVEYANEGIDSVQSGVGFVLPAHVENLTLTGSTRGNATGNSLANVLVGNAAVNDLTGGAGADTLTGGPDRDKFVIRSIADSPATARAWDEITDFTSGVDTIDLSGIDLSPANGRQKFTFVGTAAFASSGELRFDGGTQFLYGNTDADVNTIEFAVKLTGVTALSAGDLFL